MADYCIVASQYTRRTLLENGVPPGRVFVIPYGIDVASRLLASPRPSNLFRVLFVGQKIHRKGLSYLLEAWSRLKLPNAELVVAGVATRTENSCDNMPVSFATLTMPARPISMHSTRQADLFCMPSLSRRVWFGVSGGISPRTAHRRNPNTGAVDLITHGQEGFIVPIRDSEAIARCLEWAYRHRGELRDMRVAAFDSRKSLLAAVSRQRGRSTRTSGESGWVVGIVQNDQTVQMQC